jgi:hypothetical protein
LFRRVLIDVSRPELHDMSSFVDGISPTEAEVADRCRLLDETISFDHI